MISMFSRDLIYSLDLILLVELPGLGTTPSMAMTTSRLTFVKTITTPQSKKKSKPTLQMSKEATQKDIQRAFSLLIARFAIVQGHAKYWG
jgi:hypothetical protein